MNKDLNNIVNNAKESLIKQQQAINKANQENSNEDLYAEFRQENQTDNTDNNSYNEGEYELQYSVPNDQVQEDIELDNNYENDVENPYIANVSETPQELFPGGPTVQQINAWKKEYGPQCDIFVIKIDDMYFVARNLNRYEYKQLVSMQSINSLEREEIICENVVLFPKMSWKNMAASKAGLPSTLSEIIMKKSGFTREYMIQVI